jgi:formylglycine-generating enzyme required for sulfatase activity
MSSTLPHWASGWGQDRYGEWLELTLGEVKQRMRWIPPGCFLMGSPEDEPGRYGEDDGYKPEYEYNYEVEYGYNEGPRHEVTISRGFWLFDTPVTQALWQAVLSHNPSEFLDPKRPVENVFWADAARFVTTINLRIPNLDLVLPTEAQWEYACRAGTETATYAGPMEILGKNNAPVLDAIAWHRGNSGVEFDLPATEESSPWLYKEYKHLRMGTRRVGLKKPNLWGCYDMLGNVLEWCADDRRKYTADSATDPVGSCDSNTRALRGGSWYDAARDVRAAFREEGDLHDYCRAYIGFRCARVQL